MNKFISVIMITQIEELEKRRDYENTQCKKRRL